MATEPRNPRVTANMFCTRCGKENRDDASFCVQCGANMVQAPAAHAQVLARPSADRKVIWIVGAVVFLIVLSLVISIPVCVRLLHSFDQSGHVIIDGKTLVGADGDPIELVRNPEADDVTWAELMHFLSSDQTDKIPYYDGTFVCADFSESLFNNAHEAGIRAGYVFVDFGPGETAHTCNAFQTTDRGIVYIDDTGTLEGLVNADKTVDLAIGASYCPESIFPNRSRDFTWECLGTVSSFAVTW